MIEISVKKQLGSVGIRAAFSISAPGITAIFGDSGAGKTSVINMIAGLIRPDEGSVRVHGTTLFDSKSRVNVAMHKRRIGYVFQDGRLFPHLDVKQNLLYGAHNRTSRATLNENQDGAESGGPLTSRSLSDVGELLGITHLFVRRPGQLSGGEKQRVAIGRALLANPRLLLMDEPLASLDAPRKNELLPYIARLPAEVGVPVIYVTHSMDEIERLADQVLYMRDGIATEFGPTEEVLNKPGSSYRRSALL
ncbi:MAG: molybdenum ABC transporter ATP-binding protein [Spirochaeta sp.]|nr:molybdenum ABC transporter ATP-binding protein [Spirochaeta sp.]